VRGIEKERDMTKRWIAPVFGLALALSVGTTRPAAAFKLKGPKPAAPGATQAAGTTTVTGIIKGAPTGKTYTVVSGKRTAQVDTSHAQVRSKGKFASLAPGAFIRATGTMNGATLNATSVEVIRPAGGGKKAAAGGKMAGGSKMGGGKKGKK
jgi:hypothetical protein